MVTLPMSQWKSCKRSSKRKCVIDSYIFIILQKESYSDTTVKKIKTAIAAAHFIKQYYLNRKQQRYFLVQSRFFSWLEE